MTVRSASTFRASSQPPSSPPPPQYRVKDFSFTNHLSYSIPLQLLILLTAEMPSPHESPPSCDHLLSSVPLPNIYFFLDPQSHQERSSHDQSQLRKHPTTNFLCLARTQEKEISSPTMCELYMMSELFYILRRGVR